MQEPVTPAITVIKDEPPAATPVIEPAVADNAPDTGPAVAEEAAVNEVSAGTDEEAKTVDSPADSVETE
jgi:hypothetical protein